MHFLTFALVHADDIDGIGSAAVIRMAEGTKLRNIYFTGYTKERAVLAIRSLLEQIKRSKEEGTTILFIADLGDSLLKHAKPLLYEVRKINGYCIWLDHHPWSKESIAEVSKLCDFAIVGENKSACATEIALAFFKINNKFARKFGKLVHYSDFHIQPRGAKEREWVKNYALAITKCNMLREPMRSNALRRMARDLSAGVLMSSWVVKEAQSFEMENSKRIEEMSKKAVVIGNVAIGFADGVQTTDACMHLIDEKNVDIGIVVSPKTGKGSIRSIKSKVNKLAERLGGGGHEHAAGFNVKVAKAGERGGEFRKRVVRKIIKAASDLGLLA